MSSAGAGPAAPPPASGQRSVEAWTALIAEASGVGDHLLAIDLAARGLREHPESLPLLYRRLLAFARAGATRRAESQLAALEHEGRLEAIPDARLRMDFAALRGRLLKDRAIAALGPDERARLAAQAAAAYERVYQHSGGCFPAVNAASLWRIAGQPDRATAMARAALAAAAAEADPYWRRATEGEALVLLGDEAEAARALRAAAADAAGRLDAVAATRRQLAWLAGATGLGAAALAAMPVPLVLHWLADPADGGDDPVALVALPDGGGGGVVAIGSLLSPADIAVAEALRGRGAELGLVLPCAPELCRASLGRRGGAGIADRFDRLIGGAKLSVVTPEGDPGEPTVRVLALTQARGHALLRGAALMAPVRVLTRAAGRVGLDDPAADAANLRRHLADWPDRGGDPMWAGRTAKAIVFGDIQGFSGISEAQHLPFLETVLGGFADALAPLRDDVEYAETAGDGIYVVLSNVVAAVRACHALHHSVDPARLIAAGLPAGLALRLSAHVGPVFRGLDRVTGREKFFGKEVVRTARIEPVTPPGETYVTEQFASVLYCQSGSTYRCDYVGHQPMAKGFGECRMYSLRTADV
jgi:hypothetical protein